MTERRQRQAIVVSPAWFPDDRRHAHRARIVAGSRAVPQPGQSRPTAGTASRTRETVNATLGGSAAVAQARSRRLTLLTLAPSQP